MSSTEYVKEHAQHSCKVMSSIANNKLLCLEHDKFTYKSKQADTYTMTNKPDYLERQKQYYFSRNVMKYEHTKISIKDMKMK